MIELHLIEDKIYYGVVEEFLFTKIHRNSKMDIFRDCGITKFRDNNLISCLKWLRTNMPNIQKSTIIKYQATNQEGYKLIMKVYATTELEKYFLLF